MRSREDSSDDNGTDDEEDNDDEEEEAEMEEAKDGDADLHPWIGGRYSHLS